MILFPLNDGRVCEAINRLAENHFPVITLNSDLKNSKRLCFVGENVVQTGQTAARLTSLLLGGQGCICVLSSQIALQAVAQREQAYLEYLPICSPGIEVTNIIDTYEDPEYAYACTSALLEQNAKIDGLFITCGNVASICKAVKAKGMKGALFIIAGSLVV